MGHGNPHAGDRFLIVDEDLLPVLDGFKGKVDFERIFVVRSGGDLPAGMEDYDDLIATATGDFDYPAIDENDACGMVSTTRGSRATRP